jgi:hypothetical protein
MAHNMDNREVNMTQDDLRAGRRKSDVDFSLMLGEILGQVKAIDQRIYSQNGHIADVTESVNRLFHRVDKLPCDLQAERLASHINEHRKVEKRRPGPWLDRGSGAGGALFIALTVYYLIQLFS